MPLQVLACASVRLLSPYAQVRIEELQCSTADILVQLGPIHTRGIDAGFWKVIPSHLVALVTEYFVANRSGQHIE